jgi:hypothetical protein
MRLNATILALSAGAQSIATSTASAALGTSSANVTNINTANPVDGAFNATVWALIVSRLQPDVSWKLTRNQYTYPLYIFGNFAGNVIQNVGVNTIFNQRNLASIDSPGVIKPNIDTL